MPDSGAEHVNAIAGRLSLRPPQRHSLEILHRVTELVPLRKDADPAAALEAIKSEFGTVTDFERTFPSLCFALATGVGKTRLMGGFIAYLHLAHGVNNFFVLAPNLTIYDKLIADFTPNTSKYVLRGISEFAVAPPLITTGDTYERQIASGGRLLPVSINVFNISKINAEVRGGRSPRIHSFREEIGETYFDYLAGLPDLVMIMDESHRYRASAGIRAINELRPVLGLELTATPQVETGRGPIPFKNIIYEYPLRQAMADGFVKEPAVVTRKDFLPAALSLQLLEQIKLEDGVRLHERVKAELATYALQTGERLVKPFVLVIARDTAHAGELMQLIRSPGFFEGRYAEKAIQIDSSVKEEETVSRLLKVEQADEPTEIVVHVNMLKEGWDVTNLYTIVPLRAANARTLIEQSIGRGLRLPYGRRTGVTSLDRLNIVAHDRFQEMVDEASRPGSAVRLRQVVLDGGELGQGLVTVVSRPRLAGKLGLNGGGSESDGRSGLSEESVAFNAEEREIAALAYEAIRRYETRPEQLPSVDHLRSAAVQAAIAEEVAALRRRPQGRLTGIGQEPDIAGIVARTAELVANQTIDIPRILVVPRGEVRSGFQPFALDLSALRYETPGDALWAEHLRTGEVELIEAGLGGADGRSLEDQLVDELAAFGDVAYDTHADLLYGLAEQVANHLRASLTGEDAQRVIRVYRSEIARLIHDQMQEHRWQEMETGYNVEVKRGFTVLRPSAYTAPAGETPLDFRAPAPAGQNIARHLFAGFERCLYPTQKFHSEAERRLAVILERDALKWFKPAKGQFQLFYRDGAEHLEYQPDFVAETDERVLMIECKASNQMQDRIVLAKRDTAVEWCRHATDHAAGHGGKPWRYALVPHDAIAPNMSLSGLVARFAAPA
jgi:type III restriction enzyme